MKFDSMHYAMLIFHATTCESRGYLKEAEELKEEAEAYMEAFIKALDEQAGVR